MSEQERPLTPATHTCHEKHPRGPGSRTSNDGDKWTTGEQLIGIYYFFSKKEGLFPVSRAAVEETAGKNV